MRLKHLLVLLAMVVFAQPQSVYSQEEDDEEEYVDENQPIIDSLLSLIKSDSPDSLKARLYSEIASASQNFDTVFKYANLSLPLCSETDYFLLGQNNFFIGRAYHVSDENALALPYMNKAIGLLGKTNKPTSLISVYQNMSYIYDELNNLDSSVYFLNKTLEMGNRLNDTALVAESYQDLGIMYGQRELYDESKTYLRKALILDSLSKNRFRYAMDLFCLVQLIDNQEPDSVQEYLLARDYMNKVINVLDTVDTYHKYLAYGTFVSVYIELAKRTNEHKYADSSLYYYKKAEPFFENAASVTNYRLFRYYYVEYLMFYKKYNEALKVMHELEETFNENTSALECADFHRQYKSIYIALGDYKNAYFHLEKQQQYDRANFNDSTMSVLSDVKAQQVSMMEKLRHENAEKLHAAEKQKMRIVIFSLIGGLALISLLVFYILKSLGIKKKANTELSKKNSLLAEKNDLLAEKNNQLAEQKEEIEAQRDHIEAQNKEIQASINYARRIQRALLTPDEAIASVFPDYFLLYKPRSVVSGDFYWVGQFGDNKVCIVADCTGHGVPGGFMSVLGMTNLNYIVGQDIAPEAILNKLRDAIMWNLRQKEGNPEELTAQVLDGMDVAAYVVNERQMTLSFAGANNPLVLIRDGEVQVIKPDKMPVGISVVMKPFQSVTMELHKGDCLYTYSDGFQDQFNIESEKKFQKSRLRDLLLEIHQRPMNEQRELLNLVFKEWRGPAENQTDDVVIMGVRI